MSRKRKRGYRFCQAIPVRSLCSCGPGHERVWYRASWDKPAGEWDRIAMKMTQMFEEALHPILCCAEPFLKADLKSKKGKATTHFQSTSPTMTIIIRTILASTPQCVFGLITTIETKKQVIVQCHNFLTPISRI